MESAKYREMPPELGRNLAKAKPLAP